ncbi:MAG: hypothetical protein RMN52_16515 [Anaerolineae bacterium]|nr:hypothetical protein [Candidatus Roseilinea sp.]MDW8451603.1 hypothetical protein [Anaerolineae bacterium]
MRFASGQEQAAGVRSAPDVAIAPGALSLLACLPRATWLAPLAVISGAIASGAIFLRSDWMLALAMAVLLALAWVSVWSVIAGVNWSAPLAIWQRWTQGTPLKTLPYTRPDSDAAYVSRRVGQLMSWLRQALLPRYGGILASGATGLAVMVVLAAALGSQAMLLAIGVLCIAQIAVVACRGDGRPNAILEGATVVGLPVMLGAATFAPVALDILLVGAAAAVIFAGARDGSPWLRNAGYALAVVVAVATRQPVSAFALAVIWAPQLILGLQRNGYGWLAAGMLAFAVARVAGG